jgi:hypothetical protein
MPRSNTTGSNDSSSSSFLRTLNYPRLESRPQNSCCLKAWFPHASSNCWIAQCQQASLRASATCRLSSPAPAAAAVAPGSPRPSASSPRSRATNALWATDGSSSPAFLLHGYPQLATQSQKPATTCPSGHQAPGSAILWHQEAFPPTVPDIKRALTPPPKSKNARWFRMLCSSPGAG